MGALTNYAEYKNKIEAALGVMITLGMQAGLSGTSIAWSGSALNTVPTASVSCDYSTLMSGGEPAARLPGTLTNELWLAKAETFGPSTTLFGSMLVDLLNVSGGLNGTLTTAQTTGLPTAALPRYTDGVGVCIGIRIYTAVGATATTLTCSYTNQAGTAGRTSKPIVFGGASANTAGVLLIVPLQDGDTGVRSVESITVAATTGTAGNFGVWLFKPLALLPSFGTEKNGQIGYAEGMQAGRLVKVFPNACLYALSKYGSGSAYSQLTLIEA